MMCIKGFHLIIPAGCGVDVGGTKMAPANTLWGMHIIGFETLFRHSAIKVGMNSIRLVRNDGASFLIMFSTNIIWLVALLIIVKKDYILDVKPRSRKKLMLILSARLNITCCITVMLCYLVIYSWMISIDPLPLIFSILFSSFCYLIYIFGTRSLISRKQEEIEKTPVFHYSIAFLFLIYNFFANVLAFLLGVFCEALVLLLDLIFTFLLIIHIPEFLEGAREWVPVMLDSIFIMIIDIFSHMYILAILP